MNPAPVNPPDAFRLFVALRLPADVVAGLIHSQGTLVELLPRRSLTTVNPDNLHLTLRFLGDVDKNALPELVSRLRSVAEHSRPLNLTCAGIGCFPDLRYPRVIWAGVRDAESELDMLSRRLEESIGSFAAKPAEERFVGHITLARCHRIGRGEAERLAKFVSQRADQVFGSWRCGELVLIRSELLPSGARYSILCEADLGPCRI
jgi:2'-5' RNA ligase